MNEISKRRGTKSFLRIALIVWTVFMSVYALGILLRNDPGPSFYFAVVCPVICLGWLQLDKDREARRPSLRALGFMCFVLGTLILAALPQGTTGRLLFSSWSYSGILSMSVVFAVGLMFASYKLCFGA